MMIDSARLAPSAMAPAQGAKDNASQEKATGGGGFMSVLAAIGGRPRSLERGQPTGAGEAGAQAPGGGAAADDLAATAADGSLARALLGQADASKTDGAANAADRPPREKKSGARADPDPVAIAAAAPSAGAAPVSLAPAPGGGALGLAGTDGQQDGAVAGGKGVPLAGAAPLLAQALAGAPAMRGPAAKGLPLDAAIKALGSNPEPRELVDRMRADVVAKARAPSASALGASPLDGADDASEESKAVAPPVSEIIKNVTVSSLETHFPAVVSNMIATQAAASPGERPQSVNVVMGASQPVSETIYKAGAPARVLTIELTPPSLGTVTVRMKMSRGGVDLDIKVDSASALNALGATRDRLVDAIQASGYTVDSYTVHVGSASASSDNSQYAGSNQGSAWNGYENDHRANLGQERGQPEQGSGSSGGERQARRDGQPREAPGSADRRNGLYL